MPDPATVGLQEVGGHQASGGWRYGRGWTTRSRVDLPVRGGRGGGYRTYSVKTGISQGAWRVNVETPSGALLGRLRFNIVLQDGDPPLVTQIKN